VAGVVLWHVPGRPGASFEQASGGLQAAGLVHASPAEASALHVLVPVPKGLRPSQ
jgi:hypothetical protein